MPRVGFEPTILIYEQATVIGHGFHSFRLSGIISIYYFYYYQSL
jgi:hypothetical protein